MASPPSPLTVSRLNDGEFQQLKNEWNALLSRSRSNNVFLRWEWISSWWEVFARQRTLFILAVRQEGRLVGIAPFYIEPAAGLTARHMRFCSDDRAPDYMDVIIEPGLEKPVMDAIARCLQQHADKWDILFLDSMLCDAVIPTQLSSLEGLAYIVQEAAHCPYIPIEGPFEEHIQQRHDLLKLSLPKKHKKFFAKDGVRLVRVQDRAALPDGLRDLFKLHKMRSDNKGRQTNFASADVERFHGKLAASFLDQGILDLSLIYDGETPVSAHYGFRYANKIYYYAGGFNLEYKNYSVGSLSIYLAIQTAFAEKMAEYDFLKGEESYKSLWSSHKHRQLTMKIYSPTWRGQLWRAARRLADGLKAVRNTLAAWKSPSSP
ncbi:MAG: GNAT family N-acetyltransferase [Elusimicrobiota bacterium]|mgnify:CR=1 FL=1